MVGDEGISGLTDPIVMTLPLPIGATAVHEVAEVLTHDCGNATLVETARFTSQDKGRAKFCYDIDIDENTPPSGIPRELGGRPMGGGGSGGGVGGGGRSDDTISPNELLQCANGMYEEQMNCSNTTGQVAITCPKKESAASCRYYDTYSKVKITMIAYAMLLFSTAPVRTTYLFPPLPSAIQNWTDDNCTYWYSDYEQGYAVCNCTHLTDFSAQQEDTFSEQTSTFTDTVSSVEDLSLTDLAKNWHILTVLVLVWAFCLGLYYRDQRTRKVLVMQYIVKMYRNDKIQSMLKNLERVAGPEKKQAKTAAVETIEVVTNPMAATAMTTNPMLKGNGLSAVASIDAPAGDFRLSSGLGVTMVELEGDSDGDSDGADGADFEVDAQVSVTDAITATRNEKIAQSLRKSPFKVKNGAVAAAEFDKLQAELEDQLTQQVGDWERWLVLTSNDFRRLLPTRTRPTPPRYCRVPLAEKRLAPSVCLEPPGHTSFVGEHA